MLKERPTEIELNDFSTTHKHQPEHVCCVCLEEFDKKESDYAILGCCAQSIHIECLCGWLIKRGLDASCPTCRHTFTDLQNIITFYELYHTFVSTYCNTYSPLYLKYSKLEIINVNELFKKYWSHTFSNKNISLKLDINILENSTQPNTINSYRLGVSELDNIHPQDNQSRDIESGNENYNHYCGRTNFFFILNKLCFFTLLAFSISFIISQMVIHNCKA